MRGETARRRRVTGGSDISIHSPHARGDRHIAIISHFKANFNPLPSCEGRPCQPRLHSLRALQFQSTPLMRGETIVKLIPKRPQPFQSTPLMRGETFRRYRSADYGGISIHSPHARGDDGESEHVLSEKISIHSPHARGDARICNSMPLPS